MLRKLKIRLILHNMLVLGLVSLILFSAFSFLIYIQEETQITNLLQDNMDSAKQIFSQQEPIDVETNGKIYKVSFTVSVDKSGNILKSTENNYDKEFVNNAIDFALDQTSERGNNKELNISFLCKETGNGFIISFISREHLKERIGENLSYGALAGLLFLAVFGAISIRFANMALAPVEKAWEQQKQFLADASHDLKTPLTVILANTNIISSHPDQTVESQMKWMESTREEASRMTDLVNKMLELAKSEAARDELKIGEYDLGELVEHSILQFEVVAFDKNITIESGIQPDIFVRTHPQTFSKVLEILFDNAIKYSPEGGKISVALYQSGKKIYFTINNRGEIIPEEDLPHVFERFYRTNKERKVGGHGLGLSIAKKKCDMLGCKLSVESNADDGTTFTIALKPKKQK